MSDRHVLSPLSLHPLTRLPEGDGVLVGRADGESYAVLPRDGAALLERLIEGAPPPEAAAWYRDTYGETIDIDDFVSTLAELGFVRERDQAAAAAEAVGLQRLARAFLSRPAFVVYAAIVATWAWTLARRPELAPSPHHVFFTDSTVAVELLIVFGQLPWLFLHESFHVLAGRRLGLSSRLGLGTRLYFVVFETRMPSLLSVERRRRHLPFLAGMLADVLIVASLGVLAYATGGIVRALALAMAFPVCTRFAYQFLLFLQTDVYFALATALGCYDLHAATKARIANRYWRARRRPGRVGAMERWTERDRRVASWYEPFFAAGIVVLLGVWVFALLPVAEQLLRLIADALGGGTGDPRFWDAALFVTLNVSQVALLFHLSRRERRALTPEPA